MNQKIAAGQACRSGVLLKINENHALAKADVEERKV